ncbi:MAG: putative membrane protein YkvI [Gammaproteobacteria bacterium]|jgi:uncharacterized membrane protein YkvI
MRKIFLIFLLPGAVFQSIIVAGGYGTGQELSIFFLSLGPKEGLLAIVLIPVPVISLSAVLSFELARLFRAYDYRSFFQLILGRGWFIWEIGFLLSLTIFFGVMGSAAGEIFSRTFSLPYFAGTLFLMGSIALLVFWGSIVVERVLSVWSLVLYLTYILFFVWAFSLHGDNIGTSLAMPPTGSNWLLNGTAFAGLQLSMMPAALFALHHIKTRKQAVIAGLLVGPIAMIPGILFYLVMLSQYPAIKDVVLPSNFLLESLNARWFQVLFQVVLLGTLIETGTGVIHAFNERVASLYRVRNQTMPRKIRPIMAIILMIIASLLTKIGLVDLIMIGVKYFAWFFLVIFLVPLLTVGIYRIVISKGKVQ